MKNDRVDPKKIIVTRQTDLARLFGVSVGTIAAWRLRGMPGRQGEWPLAEIITWHKRRLLEAAGINPDIFL